MNVKAIPAGTDPVASLQRSTVIIASAILALQELTVKMVRTINTIN